MSTLKNGGHLRRSKERDQDGGGATLTDDKGFHFHTITTDPNYTDPSAGPATAALWKYKAIYRLRDEQVGNWSDVISVAVGS